MTYAALLEDVQAGRLVAVAPVVNDRGESSLVIVTGHLPPLHRMHMAEASDEQRAVIAVRAVAQVRRHFEV